MEQETIQQLSDFLIRRGHILDTIDASLPFKQQYEIIKREGNYGDELPQVEIFCELLQTIDSDMPTMVELGSSGIHASYYSILFEKWFNGRCKIVNVEPNKDLIEAVPILWNNRHLTNAVLYHGYVGTPKHYSMSFNIYEQGCSRLYMKDIFSNSSIETLDILHFDIQGSETSVCEELRDDGLLRRVRYMFISTHHGEGKTTHNDCKEIVSKNMNCKFHFDDPYRGGCGDGLLIVENMEWSK